MAAPVMDAGVLSALTERIQSQIKAGTVPKKSSATQKKAAASEPRNSKSAREENGQSINGKKRKRETERKETKNYQLPPKGSKGSGRKATSLVARPEPTPSKKSKLDIAAQTKREKPSRGGPSSRAQADKDIDLRSIVLELGGDNEDLGLIEGAGSESEMEGEAEDGKTENLKNDLQSMIQSLGLPQAQPAAEDTSEEGSDVSHNNEDDEEGDTQAGSGGVTLDRREDYGEDETDDDDEGEPELISQVKQALDKLPERKKPNRNGLFVEPQSEWHSVSLPGISASNDRSTNISARDIQKLHEHAKRLLESENERYAATNKSSNSASQFYATIMSSGTLSDKISALTLSVQESPLHNVKTLESLVNLAKKRNRGQATEVLGALKDLLSAGSLLPSGRRLRYFTSQPALKFVSAKQLTAWQASKSLPRPLTEAHLIMWAYEDFLKSAYFEVLQVLEIWLGDEIAFARGKALGFVYELLRDKPEQEANLLRLLVNKLGDKDKQIASKASYYLLQVQNAHPAMKTLIISSVESDLIFKKHQSNHAKYYGIVTLNQTVLSAREEALARQILNTYFALFLELLKKKPSSTEEEPSEKAVSEFNSKGDRQGGGSVPGKKAQKKAAAQARAVVAEDELREKMLSAVLTGVNRGMPYVDKSSDFFDKHMDTLFRVTHSANFNTSVQALMLIQQLSGIQSNVSSRFYRTLYESLLDPRLLTSSKQALYLNLLFRALRADLNVKRIQAFTKRLLQITAMQQPSFACAVIYLIHELEAVFPSLSAYIDQAEADESDEEEVFRDVPDKEDDAEVSPAEASVNAPRQPHQLTKAVYDGRKRDPEHANAERSSLWELAPLQHHFHPSVSLFATSLLKHEKMPSKPDLGINTLIHFLDRFVYRNPKKTENGLRGQSLMQPLVGSGDTSGLLVAAKDRKTSVQAPVNTENFRNKKGDNVGADEVFFHKYFNEIGKRSDKAKKKGVDKKKKNKDDEDSGVSDAEDEDEIWQALVDSRPEIEGDEEEGEGWDDMEDFEEAMRDSDEDEALGAEPDGDDMSDSGDEAEEDGGFDLDDEDGLFGSDDELPDGLLAESDEADEPSDSEQKQSKTKNKKKSERKKMLKSLPMFASADDYAAMLEDDDE